MSGHPRMKEWVHISTASLLHKHTQNNLLKPKYGSQSSSLLEGNSYRSPGPWTRQQLLRFDTKTQAIKENIDNNFILIKDLWIKGYYQEGEKKFKPQNTRKHL